MLAQFGAKINIGKGVDITKERPQRLASIRKEERADQQKYELQPKVMQVYPEEDCTVPPFAKGWVKMRPKDGADYAEYDYQKFLFRDCLCPLEGTECDKCAASSAEPPTQLAALQGGVFNVCFWNTQPQPWLITEGNYTVEFQNEHFSCAELAKELQEEMEISPLVTPYTTQEIRENFDMTIDTFRDKLQDIICEPAGYAAGPRDATLKLYPGAERPEFAEKGITIKEYLQSNPCEHCRQAGWTKCEPVNAQCTLSKLYEPQLPMNFESTIIVHPNTYDIQAPQRAEKARVICLRAGSKRLENSLNTIDKGRNIIQQSGHTEIWTDRTEARVLLSIRSKLPTYKVVEQSTAFLIGAKKTCEAAGRHELDFPNYEELGISHNRLQRVYTSMHQNRPWQRARRREDNRGKSKNRRRRAKNQGRYRG